MISTRNAAHAHFEHKVNARVFPVLPGEHLVIDEPGAAVSTLLGSCVSACIRDRRRGFGGLNHFLLPGEDGGQSARYGAYAIKALINEILGRGCLRSDLEAKVFGGGEVIASSGGANVGRKNAAFVRGYLRSEEIAVLAEDLGGPAARRIYYFPHSGAVRVQYLAAPETRQAAAGEAGYRRRLASQPKSGEVELFQ